MGISRIFPTGNSLSSVYLGLLSQPTLLSKHWPQEGGTLLGTQPRLENITKIKHSEDVFIHKVPLALKKEKRKERKKIGKRGVTLLWNAETSLWAHPLHNGMRPLQKKTSQCHTAGTGVLVGLLSSSRLFSLHCLFLQNGGWQQGVLSP